MQAIDEAAAVMAVPNTRVPMQVRPSAAAGNGTVLLQDGHKHITCP